MAKDMFDLRTIVEKEMKQTFEDICNEQFLKLQEDYVQQIARITEEAKITAKKKAQLMAIELFQKSNVAGISIEFKL